MNKAIPIPIVKDQNVKSNIQRSISKFHSICETALKTSRKYLPDLSIEDIHNDTEMYHSPSEIIDINQNNLKNKESLNTNKIKKSISDIFYFAYNKTKKLSKIIRTVSNENFNRFQSLKESNDFLNKNETAIISKNQFW